MSATLDAAPVAQYLNNCPVIRSEGRRFIYRPLVSEGQVRRSMVSDLTSQLFRGDVTALVNHLLSEHDIDSEELAQLREMIASRERKEDR